MFGRERKGPLAPSKVKHRAAPFEVPPHALRQGIPRRGSAGEFCVSQRQAKQLGNFQCIEHRPARRPDKYLGALGLTAPKLARIPSADLCRAIDELAPTAEQWR